jgi:uncharacterized membrane protein YphA (DoxX/SURF4 family)
MPANDLWRSIFRITVGVYWLYFASQKWTKGIDWMRPLIQESARVNPIPGLHEFLVVVVAPNWSLFALAQSVGETVIGVLLVGGLATRMAAFGGTLLALNLALTVAFLFVGDPSLRWLYYLALAANAELIFTDPGRLALGRTRFVPSWLRS